MNIPSNIRKHIKESAKHHQKANENQKIFEKWIEDIYGEEVINDDGVRDIIIDTIEQGDGSESAIKMLESRIQDAYDS